MKTALFTPSIGNDPGFIPAILSAKIYAEKHGIDYFVSNSVGVRFMIAHFEKFQGFNLFDLGYDRVLFLDRDVLINPDAPDIFECYPDMDTLYALDENADIEHMDRDYIVDAISSDISWPRNERGKYRYFNSGVLLVSRNFKEFIDGFRNTRLYDIPQMRIYYEQTCLNYMAAKKLIRFKSLDECWNRMDKMVPDPENHRHQAHFIHYAGTMAFVPNQDKRCTIRKDFIHFYSEELLNRQGTYSHFISWTRKLEAMRKEPLPCMSDKKYSIVFPGAQTTVELDQYLQHLPVQQLSSDCELLFFDDCPPSTCIGGSGPLGPVAKTINVIFELDFDSFCAEVARQATGQYVLFLNKPANKDQLLDAVRQLQGCPKTVAMDSEKNFLIVKRLPFLNSGGLIEQNTSLSVV